MTEAETTYPPLDATRALELLTEIVEERPDYVYKQIPFTSPSGYTDTRCYYERDGQPSCLVGHVLARAGYPMEFLRSMDDASFKGKGAHTLHKRTSGAVTGTAADLLQYAQGIQDHGGTWEVALDAAKHFYDQQPEALR